MRSQRNIRQLFARSGVTVDPSVDDRTIGDALQALDQSEEALTPAPREPEKRRILMNRRMKIAVAATILLAVLGGVHFLGGSADGTGVVWAQVARQMETIDNFTCRMTSWRAAGDNQSREEMTMKFWYSDAYGFRMEQYSGGELVMIECLLRQTSEGVRIWPQEKAYVRRVLSEQELSLGPAQKMDPRDWVRRFTQAKTTSLGRRVTEGAETEGVETRDLGVIRSASSKCEDYAARLWIDVQTQLPVGIEEEYTMGGMRTGGGADQFEWNPGLTAADIEPEIPADYVNREQ
jgi:hypothetical protein